MFDILLGGVAISATTILSGVLWFLRKRQKIKELMKTFNIKDRGRMKEYLKLIDRYLKVLRIDANEMFMNLCKTKNPTTELNNFFNELEDIIKVYNGIAKKGREKVVANEKKAGAIKHALDYYDSLSILLKNLNKNKQKNLREIVNILREKYEGLQAEEEVENVYEGPIIKDGETKENE